MKDNFFTKKINKIVLISDDDKRMQSIVSIETYVYGKSKNIASGPGKTNALLIVTNNEPDVDKKCFIW